jgi:hypothetical protein
VRAKEIRIRGNFFSPPLPWVYPFLKKKLFIPQLTDGYPN